LFSSSRRRHTRSKRDWSSDVCSSDLDDPAAESIPVHMNSNGTLSDEDAKFASQYAAQLLNPLRQKAGSPVYKITNGSLKIAQDRSEERRVGKECRSNASLID